MNFKIKSDNTTHLIQLHDCLCKKLRMTASTLVLDMEWVEVEACHPNNPYDLAHSSDEVVIEFKGAVILDINDEPTDAISEHIDTEIMGFSETKVSSSYRYGVLDFFDETNNFMTVTFLFESSSVMWNELTGISWFEERRHIPEISTDQILKMLSWHNSDDVQQKGMALAEKVRYLGHFFQPVIDNESKSLWENCAEIISRKADKELSPWLMDCFIWLQDMNWPGAEKIADRLKKMRSYKKFEYTKQKAIRIAELIKDEEWTENLKQYL